MYRSAERRMRRSDRGRMRPLSSIEIQEKLIDSSVNRASE